jgi:hypothetical protein
MNHGRDVCLSQTQIGRGLQVASSDLERKTKTKTKEEKMKMRTQIAVITLAVATSSLLVWNAPGENHTPTIQGVWQVSRVGVNCNNPDQPLGIPFPAIMTFHRDGTVTGAAKSPVTGPFDTPEYGSWRREQGSQDYSFREVQYRYDGSGTFLGSLVISANVELTGANSFIYAATIRLTNANGDLINTLCGRATGTRFE